MIGGLRLKWIALLPHNTSEARTMALVAQQFHYLKPIFLDMSAILNDDDLGKEIEATSYPYIPFYAQLLEAYVPDALFVANDWEPQISRLVHQANQIGVATFGLVTRLVDYANVLPWKLRNVNILSEPSMPYHLVQYPLLMHMGEQTYFESKPNQMVGSPLIEAMRDASPPSLEHTWILIHANATDINAEPLDAIALRYILDVLEKAGLSAQIIDIDPELAEDFSKYIYPHSLYQGLISCAGVVTSFSSSLVEMVASQKRLVCFDPQKRLETSGLDSYQAFMIATNIRDLELALGTLDNKANRIEAIVSDKFIKQYTYQANEHSASEKCATLIEEETLRHHDQLLTGMPCFDHTFAALAKEIVSKVQNFDETVAEKMAVEMRDTFHLATLAENEQAQIKIEKIRLETEIYRQQRNQAEYDKIQAYKRVEELVESNRNIQNKHEKLRHKYNCLKADMDRLHLLKTSFVKEMIAEP